jgi:lysozyme
MCRGAGLNPGCVSTAAGRYQIIRPTWVRLRDLLRLPDFGPKSQDAAAVQLLRERNALPFIESGRIDLAVARAKSEWASLPGNAAGQPQRQLRDLLAVYTRSGGTMA